MEWVWIELIQITGLAGSPSCLPQSDLEKMGAIFSVLDSREPKAKDPVMRQFIWVWGSGWLLALALAPAGWAQAEVAALLPAGQPAIAPSLPAPPDIDRREARLSPYQRWQQQHAAAEIPSSGCGEVFYRLSQEAEQSPEGLPFPLQPDGIPLGEDSPFFLHPNGLRYRQSY